MGKSDEKKMREQLQGDRSRILSEGTAAGAGSEKRAGELYPGVKAGFEDLSKTGGFDPSTYGDVMGGYQNFAQTGGYSPQDISNIRSRSSSVVPAMYSRMTENLRRRGAMSGGYQPGYGANLASMGRSAAQIGAENARDTELGISGAVREGKLAGLGGETQLAGMRQRGVMGGLGGLQDLYGSERNDVMQNRALTEGSLGNLNSPSLALATRPGAFSNVMRGLGAAASFAAPFAGMLNRGPVPTTYNPNQTGYESV